MSEIRSRQSNEMIVMVGVILLITISVVVNGIYWFKTIKIITEKPVKTENTELIDVSSIKKAVEIIEQSKQLP